MSATPKPPHALTSQEIRRAKALYARGHSIREVARMLGTCASPTVGNALRAAGVVLRDRAAERSEHARRVTEQIKQRTAERLSTVSDQLRRFHDKGTSAEATAEAMGTTKSQVQNDWRRLGLTGRRETRAPAEDETPDGDASKWLLVHRWCREHPAPGGLFGVFAVGRALLPWMPARDRDRWMEAVLGNRKRIERLGAGRFRLLGHRAEESVLQVAPAEEGEIAFWRGLMAECGEELVCGLSQTT